MGLENITSSNGFVTDLNPAWPLNTEDKREGDDHFHVTKQAIRNTFPNGNRKFYFPEGIGISANITLSESDQNKTISIDTTVGAVTVTLPTIPSLATSWGWRVTVIKVNTGPFPIFIAPPTGNLNSGQFTVAKARRSVPMCPFDVVWANNNWWVERVVNVPVASVVPFFGTTLPAGYEWPIGGSITAANYPEYVAARGAATLPNLVERVLAGSTMGTGGLGLISAGPERSGINPNTLEATGGTDVNVLTHEQMPHHLHVLRSNNQANGFATISNHELSHDHGSATGAPSGIAHTHTVPSGANSYAIFAPAGGGQAGAGLTLAQATSSGDVDAGTTLSTHTHGIGSALGTTTHNLTGFTQYTGGKGSSATGSSSDFSPQGAIGHQNMPPTCICHYVIAVE